MRCATGPPLPAASDITVSLALSGRKQRQGSATATRVCSYLLEVIQQAMGSSLTRCSLKTLGVASKCAPARYNHLMSLWQGLEQLVAGSVPVAAIVKNLNIQCGC